MNTLRPEQYYTSANTNWYSDILCYTDYLTLLVGLLSIYDDHYLNRNVDIVLESHINSALKLKKLLYIIKYLEQLNHKNNNLKLEACVCVLPL